MNRPDTDGTDARPAVTVRRGRWKRARPELLPPRGVARAITARYRIGVPEAAARIEIAADGVRVRPRSGPMRSIAREHVALVGRVKSGGWGPYRAIVFLLVGGGTWEIWLTPVKLLSVLEAYGWPVDETALLTWTNAVETAVAMDEPRPPPPASTG